MSTLDKIAHKGGTQAGVSGYARFLNSVIVQSTHTPIYWFVEDTARYTVQRGTHPVSTGDEIDNLDALLSMSSSDLDSALAKVSSHLATLIQEFPELTEFNSLDGEEFCDLGESSQR